MKSQTPLQEGTPKEYAIEFGQRLKALLQAFRSRTERHYEIFQNLVPLQDLLEGAGSASDGWSCDRRRQLRSCFQAWRVQEKEEI